MYCWKWHWMINCYFTNLLFLKNLSTYVTLRSACNSRALNFSLIGLLPTQGLLIEYILDQHKQFQQATAKNKKQGYTLDMTGVPSEVHSLHMWTSRIHIRYTRIWVLVVVPDSLNLSVKDLIVHWTTDSLNLSVKDLIVHWTTVINVILRLRV